MELNESKRCERSEKKHRYVLCTEVEVFHIFANWRSSHEWILYHIVTYFDILPRIFKILKSDLIEKFVFGWTLEHDESGTGSDDVMVERNVYLEIELWRILDWIIVVSQFPSAY